MNRMKEKWLGVTYPLPEFLQVELLFGLWAKFMCPHGYHLLDEVQSLEAHSLFCDACDLDIAIVTERIEMKTEDSEDFYLQQISDLTFSRYSDPNVRGYLEAVEWQLHFLMYGDDETANKFAELRKYFFERIERDDSL